MDTGLPERPEGAPEAETPAERPVDARQIGAMFAADLEPERVDVPGQPGSWVLLQPMDGDAFAEYLQTSQTFTVRGATIQQREGTVQLNLRESQMRLMLGTVRDFCLVRTKPALNAPGEVVREETRAPGGNVRPGTHHWQEQVKGVFRGFSREMRAWLVAECERVNGLSEEAAGN